MVKAACRTPRLPRITTCRSAELRSSSRARSQMSESLAKASGSLVRMRAQSSATFPVPMMTAVSTADKSKAPPKHAQDGAGRLRKV
eukprot:scaffold14007_cov27-Tisochrysis_lutea.AAC.1